MDARQQRTRESLERAIITLATERPLGEITVTELAKAADITRPTFYAHAESPGDLLATVLGAELEKLRTDFDRLSADTPTGEVLSLVSSERALVAHVYRFATLYRNNLRHRLSGEVRDVLIDHIEWSLLDHLARHPQIAPIDPLADPNDAEYRYREAALYAAIAASGTVAALETWLRGPDPLDQEWAVRAILRGTADWWQRGDSNSSP